MDSEHTLEIRKPTRGGYGRQTNFGHNYCSAASLARREREIYLDDELVGTAENFDGSWFVELQIDGVSLPMLELRGGMRSKRSALEQIALHIATHT